MFKNFMFQNFVSELFVFRYLECFYVASYKTAGKGWGTYFFNEFQNTNYAWQNVFFFAAEFVSAQVT